VDLPGELPEASWDTVMNPPPPLAEYAVYMDGPGPDPVALAKRQQWYDSLENSKAECMAKQGFRYVPTPFDASQSSGAGRISPMLLSLPVPRLPDSRDLVAQVGYGVMGTPEERAAAAGVADDPNLAYQETLSPGEAEAYGYALYGDYNDPAGTSASSCSGQATAQFPEPTVSDREHAFEAEFRDLKWAARSLVRTDAAASADGLGLDPRTLQLDHEWESCMNTKGYVLERLDWEHGPMLAMGRAMRTRPDGTVGPMHTGEVPGSLVPPEEKSLLGTEPERQVALADFDCRIETNYMDRLANIRISLDDKFIQEHRAALDRLTAEAESW
jgi:hypothetical protein